MSPFLWDAMKTVSKAEATAQAASQNASAADKMMGAVNLCAGLGLGLIEQLVVARWLLKKKKAKAA